MDVEILEALDVVGYAGPLLNDQNYHQALAEGPKSEAYRDAVIWLSDEIRALGQIEEQITKDNDVNTFMLELSGFLKEISCHYSSLITGHISERLRTPESRYLLLDYLISELMGLKMYHAAKPKDGNVVITLQESTTAASLKEIAMALTLGKPPDNIPIGSLFDKISTKLDEVMQRAGPKRVGKPLLVLKPGTTLSDEQWHTLETLQKSLDTEYDMRRRMLLSRLDCSIQSFNWSEKMKGREDDVSKRYSSKRQLFEQLQSGGTGTDVAALLAARDNLAVIEKTSSAAVRKNTKSKIQRHIIGQVPDRGGRAYEHAVPVPEMPSWQNRNPGGGGGGGGGSGGAWSGPGGDRGGGGENRGGGRGRGRGGPRGGFSHQPNYNYHNAGQSNYPPQHFQQQQQQQQQQQFYENHRENSHRGGGGGGGGAGGGRVQGGWSQKGRGGGGSYNDYTNRNDSGYSSRNDFYEKQQQQQQQQQPGGGVGSDYSGGGGNVGYGGRGGYPNQSYTRGGGGRGRPNYNRGGGGGRR